MPVYHHDVTNEARRLLTPCVEDGAMFLDKKLSGWHTRIDSTMRMNQMMFNRDRSGGDVLMQATGKVWPFSELDLLEKEEIRTGQTQRLGFVVSDETYDELLPLVAAYNARPSNQASGERIDPFALGYEILTELWQKEVTDRVG